MREIKFRAFDTTSRKMYSQNQIEEYTLEQFCRLGLGDDYTKFMKYTGIEDKNGVDIYEGDICHVEGLGNCEVDICKFYGTVFKKDGCEYPVIDSIAEDDLFEVIGNAYENPELLKGDL